MDPAEIPHANLREERWFQVRLVSIVVLVVGSFLGTVALKSRLQAPAYPRVQLADGTWLVCRGISIGRKHDLSFPMALRDRFMGRTQGSTETYSTSTDKMVIWLSHEGDQGEMFDLNWFKRCELTYESDLPIEPDQYHLKRDQGSHGTGTGGYSQASRYGTPARSQRCVVNFDAPIPRPGNGMMLLDVFDGADQRIAQFRLPYPDLMPVPANDWVPDALPSTQADGNLSVTLKGIQYRRHPDQRSLSVVPQLEFTHGEQPSATWEASQELRDQLGNTCYPWSCNLSPRESAWKLRLTLSQNHQGRFLPEETKVVDPMALEQAGQASFPKATHVVNGSTISILGLAGPGPVDFTLPGTSTRVTSQVFQAGQLGYGMSSQCSNSNCKIDLSSGHPFLMTTSEWGPDDSVRLVIRDQTGQILDLGGRTGAQGVSFWMFEPRSTSTSIQVQIIVQRLRRVEFLVSPPDNSAIETSR